MREVEVRSIDPTARDAGDFFVEIAFGSTGPSDVKVDPPDVEIPYFHLLMVAVHEVRGKTRDRFRPVWGGLAYLTELYTRDPWENDAEALQVLELLSDAAADRFSRIGHWFSELDDPAPAIDSAP